jgi:hypothetical protein
MGLPARREPCPDSFQVSGSRFIAVGIRTGLLTVGLACIAAAAVAQEKASPLDF